MKGMSTLMLAAAAMLVGTRAFAQSDTVRGSGGAYVSATQIVVCPNASPDQCYVVVNSKVLVFGAGGRQGGDPYLFCPSPAKTICAGYDSNTGVITVYGSGGWVLLGSAPNLCPNNTPDVCGEKPIAGGVTTVYGSGGWKVDGNTKTLCPNPSGKICGKRDDGTGVIIVYGSGGEEYDPANPADGVYCPNYSPDECLRIEGVDGDAGKLVLYAPQRVMVFNPDGTLTSPTDAALR